VLTLRADFHIHSVLSPCGDLRMSPAAIVARAVELGLDWVAISDHNNARNAPALAVAAQRAGVIALYGLEVRSVEEVDVLTLFETVEAALDYGAWVYAGLPAIPCDAARFGDQVVVDADDEVLDFVEKLLISGCEYAFEVVCDEARARGAVIIPAHVDRPANSVCSQLGWLPADVAVDAVEVSRFSDEAELVQAHRWLSRHTVARFSDAHRREEIGYQQTKLHVAAPTLSELRLALTGASGRGAEPLRQALAKET
jgi:PHP family Zn ribbon phosphoesterase